MALTVVKSLYLAESLTLLERLNPATVPGRTTTHEYGWAGSKLITKPADGLLRGAASVTVAMRKSAGPAGVPVTVARPLLVLVAPYS